MSGFEINLDQVYRRDIAPHAEALEEQRKKRLKSFYRNIALVALLAVIYAASVYYFVLYNEFFGWTVLAGVLLAIGGFIAINHPQSQHKKAVKDLVIPALCQAIGELTYERKPKASSVGADRFGDIGIVGKFTRTHLEDRFAGTYRDTHFQMVEAKLKRRGSKGRSHTVFKGLLFDIHVPKPFKGMVIMVGDKGVFANTIVSFFREQFGGLEKLQTENEAFEDRYEVYCENPEEARGLLAPGFLETMVAISEAADRKSLNAAMIDGRFLLAFPLRQDLFEIGRLHRPLDHLDQDIKELVREMTIPHRLIDYLYGERPELMP